MAKGLTELSINTNVDRGTSQTLSEIRDVRQNLSKVEGAGKIAGKVVDQIFAKTSVGAYNVQDFMTDILGRLIKLKNHPVLNEFMSTQPLPKELEKSYNDYADFDAAFRNDLVPYIFQNEVRAFDINTKEYKGDKVSEAFPVEEVEGLKFGAFVKEGTLYVDKKQLQEDFENAIFTTDEYRRRGLAPINGNAFLIQKDYNHYVYARESLRALYPFAEVQNNVAFESRYKANYKDKNRRSEDTDEAFAKRMKRLSYEEFLRDKALENIYNPWAMFKSGNAYASQFTALKKQFPTLSQNYSVVRNLLFDGAQGYKNLKLTTSKLDKDSIELYNENLRDLMDKSIMKVSDQSDNDRISEFFQKFPFFAFMQSGMNTKSQFSLGRIVPQDMFIRVMEKPQKEWMEKMSSEILQDYLNRFVEQNLNRGTRVRGKDYLSNATLEKPTVKQKPTMQTELFEETEPIKTEPKQISDGEVQDFLASCFK